MEKEIIMAGDRNNLTDEERIELEQMIAESDKWNEVHGVYDDYPEEDRAWTEYLIEEAKFTYEAVKFYRTYLKSLSEFSVSDNLRRIFHYNNELLGFFLARLRDNNMEGARIIAEIQTIIAVQKEEDCYHEFINEEMVLEPLRNELSNLGFNTKKKANWSAGFSSQHQKYVERNIGRYRVFKKRNQ